MVPPNATFGGHIGAAGLSLVVELVAGVLGTSGSKKTAPSWGHLFIAIRSFCP